MVNTSKGPSPDRDHAQTQSTRNAQGPVGADPPNGIGSTGAGGPVSPHALTFIFVTLLLDVTSLGIIIPVLPDLISSLGHVSLAEAAVYGGWLMLLFAGTQFLAAPLLGNLSDRFGRRPVLLISLFGFGVDYLIMAFAPTLVWLFIGRGLSAVCAATTATASAFIADVSPPEKRAQNFGLVGMAFGIGFILGPVIGGLLGELGPRVPFFAAAGLAFLNVIYGYLVLPESLPLSRRRRFSLVRANPAGTLMQLRGYPAALAFAGAAFLYYVAHNVYPAVWTYYTIEKFSWSPMEIGLSLAYVGIVAAVVQGWLIRKAIPLLGPVRAVIIGLIITGIGNLAYALISHGWMMYGVITISGLGAIAAPALSALMANQVPDDAQGELQGGLTSLIALSSIISPPIMTGLFSTFSNADAPVYFPGAPFALSAMLLLLAVLPVLAARR